MRQNDITGRKFGRLTAIERLPSLRPGDGFRWRCACDCGNETVTKTRLLTYKKGTRSCGCILNEKNQLRPVRESTNIRHGDARPKAGRNAPEYITWASMKQRCENPKHASYKNYGARGISVCAAWRDSYEQFLADMGRRPEKGSSIERLNPDGNYEPGNCVWLGQLAQANNRRSTVRVIAFGLTLTAAEASRKFDIPSRTVLNWSQKRADRDISDFISARSAKPA